MNIWDLLNILQAWIEPYEAALKLLALVFGPLLTAVAFYLNRADRLDIKEKAEELGKLKS